MEAFVDILEDGEIVIRIKHYDRRTGIEDKALGIFLKKAKEKGIQLTNPSGCLRMNYPEDCYENYCIKSNP